MNTLLFEDLLVEAVGRDRVDRPRDGRKEVPGGCYYPRFCADVRLKDGACLDLSFWFENPTLMVSAPKCWTVGCYIPGGNGINIVMPEALEESDGEDALRQWLVSATVLQTHHIRKLAELSPILATFKQFCEVINE